MTINLFQKTINGPILLSPQANPDLNQKDLVWVDMIAPNAAEVAAVEAKFKIDAPSESERAALEESARFYLENDTLVMNVTIMARTTPILQPKARFKGHEVQHQRQILSFFLTPTTLITVRQCVLRAFDPLSRVHRSQRGSLRKFDCCFRSLRKFRRFRRQTNGSIPRANATRFARSSALTCVAARHVT